jgi:hypothetical protein
MKRSMFMPTAFFIIAFVAMPSFAQTKATTKAMSQEEIKASVVQAQSKRERLIVKFKNGRSVSGIVWLQSDELFSVQEDHGLFGPGESVSVWISDVESVKGRNPFVKGVKTAGTVALTVVALPVMLTVCPISGLFHHAVFCPCSSGSMH